MVSSDEPQVIGNNPGTQTSAWLPLLEGLRRGLIFSAIFILAGAVLCYIYIAPLTQILLKPAGKITMVFISPGENFVAQLKLSFFAGLYLASPAILFFVYRFLSQHYGPDKKVFLIPFLAASFILFTAGILFSYFALLPISLKFLLGTAPGDISAMITIGKYLSFAGSLLFGAGLVFELPLVLLILAKIGLVTSYLLEKQRKYALLGAFVLGAIISPSPDIFTQSLLAAALLILYEISILLIKGVKR